MATLDRRRFLLAGTTLSLGAAAGCTFDDPRVVGGPTTPPHAPIPTPAPSFPGAVAGRRTEQRLHDLAAGILARSGYHLTSPQRSVLTTLRDTHANHAVALASPEPTQRPASLPSPGRPSPDQKPTGSPSLAIAKELSTLDRAGAYALLSREAKRASNGYRRAATQTPGAVALLWGSLSAGAAQTVRACALTGQPAKTPPVTRRPMAEITDVDAMRAAVQQLHAIIYGYQVAIAPLALGSSERDRAESALTQHERQRDQLIDDLLARGASVPAAKPAYALPFQPHDVQHASRMIWLMELALEPYLGQWLAGSGSADDRGPALDALIDAVRSCLDWGGPLVRWPGWPN